MANSKAERVRRSSINGTRNRLNVNTKDPNFVYRIVNDVDNRIQDFMEMGYELVDNANTKVGDKRVDNPTKEGTPVKISVGQGVQAYLMRQKKEYFEEDQKAKADRIDETESAIKRKATEDGLVGKIKTSWE